MALDHDSRLVMAALNALPAHIAVLDRHGTIVGVNDAWTAFGRANGDPPASLVRVGANYLEVCRRAADDPDASGALVGIQAVLDGRQKLFAMEYACDAPSEPRWFQMQVTPLCAPEGGAVVSHLNTTDRRQAEDALRLADRRKDEFLAMLGHELRNPLVPIRNAVRILRGLGPNDPVLRQAREMIERQVEHITRLLHDLLDASRIAGGTIVLEQETFRLPTLIERALEVVRPSIDAHGHRLLVTLPDRPPLVSGDLVRLSQALINLLDNAVKYTPDGGRIGLSAEIIGSSLALRVSDTGVGIPTELLPRVFDLFERGDPPVKPVNIGLGVGLTLVRRLIELHGGWVEVESAGPGRGSQFTLWLPLPAQAPPPEPIVPRLAEPSTGASVRILLVDDDRAVADSTAMLLRILGHEVAVAHTGEEALYKAPLFRPSVVLLDIGLNGMDGYEVARRLRRLQPDGATMFLVAVTGYGGSEAVERARAAGFNRYLIKPVDPDVLCALLADRAAHPVSLNPPS